MYHKPSLMPYAAVLRLSLCLLLGCSLVANDLYAGGPSSESNDPLDHEAICNLIKRVYKGDLVGQQVFLSAILNSDIVKVEALLKEKGETLHSHDQFLAYQDLMALKTKHPRRLYEAVRANYQSLQELKQLLETDEVNIDFTQLNLRTVELLVTNFEDLWEYCVSAKSPNTLYRNPVITQNAPLLAASMKDVLVQLAGLVAKKDPEGLNSRPLSRRIERLQLSVAQFSQDSPAAIPASFEEFAEKIPQICEALEQLTGTEDQLLYYNLLCTHINWLRCIPNGRQLISRQKARAILEACNRADLKMHRLTNTNGWIGHTMGPLLTLALLTAYTLPSENRLIDFFAYVSEGSGATTGPIKKRLISGKKDKS